MIHEVAVSIEPISDNNRAMLRGVIDYVNEQIDLQVYKIGAVPFCPVSRLRGWKGAGAVCTAESTERIGELLRLKIPRVSVSLHQDPPPSLPTVHSDNEAIGRLAARHLHEMGLTRFAFVGYKHWHHNQGRLAGFRSALRDLNLECDVVDVQFVSVKRGVWPSGIRQKPLAAALRKLDRPVGIFAAHDEFAHDVVESLKGMGIRVPYDAAVVGVNDNRLICETTSPPLSSIVQSAHRIGYVAAELLHELILGGELPQKPILLPPDGIVARRSSDFSVVEDELILAALNFVHTRCGHPITTVDVAEHVGVSRRTLDKRCVAALGHPMAEQIRLARIKKARELLSSTKMQVTTIGFMCGYESPSGFVRAFREVSGVTPEEYRRKLQAARP